MHNKRNSNARKLRKLICKDCQNNYIENIQVQKKDFFRLLTLEKLYFLVIAINSYSTLKNMEEFWRLRSEKL